MLRSIVGQTSDEFNEVSVSSQRAEHLQALDSSQRAEQPLLEDSVEHYRQSSERAECDRSSSDNIPDIERPPRSREISPTSIDSGAGQPYRSQVTTPETDEQRIWSPPVSRQKKPAPLAWEITSSIFSARRSLPFAQKWLSIVVPQQEVRLGWQKWAIWWQL